MNNDVIFSFPLCPWGTQKDQCSAAGDMSPVIEADSIEQYGRGENVRIFVVEEEPGEDDLQRWLVWLRKQVCQ